MIEFLSRTFLLVYVVEEAFWRLVVTTVLNLVLLSFYIAAVIWIVRFLT